MTPAGPRFSIVSAVYDVEPYLPAFIASIEAQRFDPGQLEVIVVDDGSTDGSLAILEAWAARRPELVTVLRQPNAGQGAARNLGLAHATGTWVTFTDPDDMLERDFFRVADRFASAHPDVEVMASKPFILEDGLARTTDTHRRRHQYDRGDRVVDLEVEPNTFGSATVSMFRLERVRALGLRFDGRIRPIFEDGHFSVCFLLGLERPMIGVLRDARYIYRRRTTGDSAMQRSLGDPGRYTDVLRFGMLDAVERARTRLGLVPAWLQQVLIYELARYLSSDDQVTTSIRIADELIPTFHDLLSEVIGNLDPEVVEAHRVRPLRSIWADILAFGCRPGDWHSPVVVRTKVDARAGLQRVAYRYVGTPPSEEFLADGAPVAPVVAKTMSHTYYGRSLMLERIVWLSAGPLEVRLDGRPHRIVGGWPLPGGWTRSGSSGRPLARYRAVPIDKLMEAAPRKARKWLTQVATAPMRLIARLPPYRSSFREAWVLMDRIYTADDNAERLFEYLRAERRDINAWFAIEKGTPDWDRLRAARVPRVVAHGSFRWTMLMLNSSWLLSSHAGKAVAEPPKVIRIVGRPTWRYAFLQHGVMKDDLSRWFNKRDIDMLVVSTPAELASVVADGTTYQLTDRETHDTGLPRFDRLLAKGREVAPDDRDLVIVAPTWRMWVTSDPDAQTHRRAVDDAFWGSDYLRNWLMILRSPEIAAAVAARGWRLAFMPHPNMQPVLPQIELPAHVEPLTFSDNDVQGLYARCALLITDYSSVAFNAAYLDRPVVNFQFDRDEVLGGGHLGRKGYFDYERDGFGPVVTDAAGAVSAVVAAIEFGPRPTPEYQARIDRTFTQRDGQACARVVAAVEALDRPFVAPETVGPG